MRICKNIKITEIPRHTLVLWNIAGYAKKWRVSPLQWARTTPEYH